MAMPISIPVTVLVADRVFTNLVSSNPLKYRW